MDQVFADEQVKLLEIAAPVDHPVLGRLHVVASPLNFDGVPRKIRRASPDPGNDADEILEELGYSEEKLTELRASGIC